MLHRPQDEHFRSALDSAPNPMLLVNEESRIVFANGAAERMFGYRPAELLDQSIEILVPESSRANHAGLVREFFDTPDHRGMSGTREIKARRNDGSLLQVEIRLSRIESPQGNLVLTSVYDISEHKRAAQRFRLAVEASPVAMLLLNHARRIVFLNSQAEKLLGYRDTELFGQTLEILVSETARNRPGDPGDEASAQQVSSKQPGLSREVHACRKDGSWFAAQISLNPIETSEGVCVLASIVEIHPQMQKLERIAILAGGIAHDFNSLLSSILADTELALSDLSYGSSAVEAIQNIRAVAIRGSEIVRELMVLAGQEKPHRELIDLSGLVRETLELLKVSVSKDAELKTSFGRNLPAIMGNPAQLRQVAMNLIINASDAINGGGVIHIGTSCVAGGADLSRHAKTQLGQQEYLKLEVSDSGRGISQSEIPKVFDPFFTTKSSGYGLGLTVVQEIVRAHGGAIHIESTVAKGSVFQVFFPCVTEPARQATAASGNSLRPNTQGTALTVLLVEDDEALRLPIAKILHRNGYRTIEAADGRTAIEVFAARSDSIDVILLDMTIPGPTGLEVLREVRRVRPMTPVILTSAFSLEMLQLPPDTPTLTGFIRKPYQTRDLLALLKTALRKPTTRQAAG